ncbi:SPOR domain-containing protein [Pelagerythrobacter marensis]|uniref:SPOR domain-containing protein n=1 Tax=Pelagerythrobacter marensis TaxID=543877 RepID=A0ABZ2D593_9SPHN
MRNLSVPVLIGALAAFGCGVPLAAQPDAVSRPVVQPLPSPAVGELTDALQRLARDSRDVDALIDAGNASLELNDIEAAIGFFGRAQELSPENPRIKLGLAGAFVRSERPLEALRLFDEAERSGVSTRAFASERGLAYDLVGDAAAAQAQYSQALAGGEDDETRRRLAISKAIAGDREGFEQTLYPLLERQDFAAFRARAFGLAILGDEDEAVAIAEAVMPRDLSARIAPYLQYMGRLTRAQQAAAANLGMFPRAAQIGRDDPRIARYSATNAPPVSSADSRLEPRGEPLGRRAGSETAQRGDSRSARRGRQRAGGRQGSEPPPQPAQGAQAAEPSPEELPPARPAETEGAAPPPAAEAQPSVPAPAPAPTPALAVIAEPVVQHLPAASDPAQPATEAAGPPDSAAPAVSDSAPSLAPGFDLGAVSGEDIADSAPAVPASVADAFAAFTLPPGATAARSPDAVDITAIEPPREVREEPPAPPAKPAPPAHPRRFWVQVATGRDLAAFKFDWRRISRKAPEVLGDFEPMTTPWGEANRLLAGPFPSEKAASEAVSKLREAGLDSFPFTSEEGQEVSPL